MRPKKCNHCGKIIENRNSTLVVWCSPLCAIAIAEKRKAAKRKKETQQMKVETRTHNEWIAILQDSVNLLVRTIDRGWPCISSGVIECQFHAGHFTLVLRTPLYAFTSIIFGRNPRMITGEGRVIEMDTF